MMNNIKKYISTLLTSTLIIACYMFMFSLNAYAQETCGGSSCSNSTCQLTLNSSGHLDNTCPSGTRYDVDPNCIMNQNAAPGSCIDTMPVDSINRVSETNCFRANGAGGNPKPRNHLGTDYASAQGTAVTAAADGVVVWAKPMGGGGRTIVIEHEKACQCTMSSPGGKCDSKYVSVYMHLQNFAVTGGSVKKGDLIGWVGGSNFSSSSGILCDYPDTNKADNCKPYGPHLHFEIHSGPWSKGYQSLKTSIINPLCDDIQQFCGGCSYDVNQCQNKTSPSQWTETNENVTKGGAQINLQQGSSSQSSSQSSMVGECPLSRYLADGDTCWFCSVFRVLFNTASTIALKAYKALADSIAIVVVVAYAIWVSVVILKHIAAVEVKDPRKLLQELMIQAFKVFLVVVILKMSFFQVMHLTLEPVFNTGMSFVQAISDGGCPSGASYLQNIVGYDSATGMTDSSSGGLPKSIGENIVCSIKSMQDSIMRMIAYGRQAWCVAWGPESFLFGILPHFAYLITSVVIMIGGFVLLISFPWCLVDCVIQMSIAAGLAPAAIGAWAFKSTGRYLKMIWDFFMNAMFNFVFLSIILYIIMTCVDQFMGALTNRNANSWGFLIDPIDGLAYWGVGGLKLVVICLMGWVFLDEGKSFADKFAKGASLGDIGRSVGAPVTQMATKLAKKNAKAILAAGGAGLQVADHFIGSKIRDKRNQYRINKVKNNFDKVEKDKDGNIIAYESTRRNFFGLGKKVTRRVEKTADGKFTWSKEKHSLRAEIANKVSDKVNQARRNIMFNRDRDENGELTNIVNEEFDDNGNLISRETQHGKEYYDAEGNVIAREHYHRNLLGRKVTTRDELGEDGKWHLSRQKSNVRMEILSKLTESNPAGALHQFAERNIIAKERNLDERNQRSKIVNSDKFLTVVSHKGRDGKVVGKEFTFRASAAKHFVNNDGTINMDTVTTIASESNLDTTTIMEGVTLSVLENRGFSISDKFSSRNVSVDKETGALTILQTNIDGSTTEISMLLGGPNGNQMLTTVTNTDTLGNVTVKKDNGIQNCTITTDNKGRQIAQYGFSNEYLRRHKYEKVLNSNGDYARNLDVKAACWGFDEKDHQLHTEQVRTGRAQVYAVPQPDGGTPDTRPDGRTPDPRPDGRTPDTRPDGGTPDPRPDGGTPDPRPDGGTPDPRPDGGTPDPRPDGGSPDPRPDGGTPDPRPDGGTPDSDGRNDERDIPSDNQEKDDRTDEERDEKEDKNDDETDKKDDDKEKTADDVLTDILTPEELNMTEEEREQLAKEELETAVEDRNERWNIEQKLSALTYELDQLQITKQTKKDTLTPDELYDIEVRIKQIKDELNSIK